MAEIAKLDVVLQLKDDQYHNRLTRALGMTEAQAKKLTTVLTGAAGVAGAFVAVGAAVTGATVALGKFAQAGGRAQTITSAFRAVVGDTEAALGELRAATNGLVDDTSLMTQANLAFTMGSARSVRDMADMAATAQALGRALGLDAAFALESLNVGIARQSRLILDNLGLVVSAEDANRKYAAAIGTTVERLSDAQRAEAFRVEAMEQARRKLDELGDTTLNAGDSFTRLLTEVKNTASAFQQGAADSDVLRISFESLRAVAMGLRGDLMGIADVKAAIMGNGSGGEFFDDQFFPDPADLQAASDAMRAFLDTMAEFRETVLAPVTSEAAAFNAEIETLEARLWTIPEPAMKLGGAMIEVDAATREAKKALAMGLGPELIDKGKSFEKYRYKVDEATAAQNRFAASASRIASVLGSIGGIFSSIGIGIPFLGGATGILGNIGGLFGSGGGATKMPKKFAGGFADGGFIGAGSWGIAGEAGPEHITRGPMAVAGPAMVTPMGGSGMSGAVLDALSSMPRVPMTPEAYALTDWFRRVHSAAMTDGRARGVR